MNQPFLWHHSNRYANFWNAYTYYMSFANRQINPVHLQDPFHTRPTNPNHRSPKKLSKRKRKARRRRARERRKEEPADSVFVEPVQYEMELEVEEEEEEDAIEIDEGYLEFLRISLKHQESRKKLQEKLNNSIKGKPFNPKDILPQEHPEELRSRELKELYGGTSDRIHAMETAMQLSFDHITSTKQPSFWPNIPLNIMF